MKSGDPWVSSGLKSDRAPGFPRIDIPSSWKSKARIEGNYTLGLGAAGTETLGMRALEPRVLVRQVPSSW